MPATLNTIAPVHAFNCPYETCKQSFRSQSDLDNHVMNDCNGEHVWCKKCKEGFPEWAAYRVHLQQSKEHIVCPVCACEFKSSGGMQRHLKQNHQSSKEIKCFACQQLFETAGGYIGHLERGTCPGHSQQQFKDTLLHKTLVSRVVEKEGRSLGHGTRQGTNAPIGSASTNPSMLSQSDSVDGGVQISLLDTDNRDLVTRPTLTPNAAGFGTSLIGGYGKSNVNDTYAKVAAANAPVMERLSLNDDDNVSTVRGGKSDDGLTSANTYNAATGLDDVANWNMVAKKLTAESNFSYKYSTKGSIKAPNQADSSGVYSQPSMSAGGEAIPVNGTGQAKNTFKAGLQALNKEYVQARTGNGSEWDKQPAGSAPQTQIVSKFDFSTKFWDPDHARFNPEIFFDAVLYQYECPFEYCSFKCEVPIDLRHHLKSFAHAVTDFRCPRCFKSFKTNAALVQHMESPSLRCGIRDTMHYQDILADSTGGYLAVSDERKTYRDKAWNRSSTTGDDGNVEEAAKSASEKYSLRYEAVKPEEFW